MKIVGTVLKILAALAAVAGAIYVIATYGDKIVAWAKNLLASCKCNCEDCDCTCQCEGDCDDCQCEDDCDDCQCTCSCECEEAPAEEAAEETPVEEAPAEEAVAEEADFEG